MYDTIEYSVWQCQDLLDWGQVAYDVATAQNTQFFSLAHNCRILYHRPVYISRSNLRRIDSIQHINVNLPLKHSNYKCCGTSRHNPDITILRRESYDGSGKASPNAQVLNGAESVNVQYYHRSIMWSNRYSGM
jgi:hypothetical protein